MSLNDIFSVVELQYFIFVADKAQNGLGGGTTIISKPF